MSNFNRGHAVGCAALRHGVPCTCWEPVAMNRLQADNARLKAQVAHLEDRLAQATQAALDFALGRPRPTQTPTQTPQQTCRDGGDNV